MLQLFVAAAATKQRSSSGGCTTHHRRLQHSAAVAGAATQRRRGGRRVVAQHACNNFQHAAPVRCPTIWRLKKYMGRAGSGEGPGGMGGAGREGEGQWLNSVVVEALAGECEPEIKCNLEFWIP